MGRLVRLVDYMLAEGVAEAVRTSSEALTHVLVRTRSLLLVEGKSNIEYDKAAGPRGGESSVRGVAGLLDCIVYTISGMSSYCVTQVSH